MKVSPPYQRDGRYFELVEVDQYMSFEREIHPPPKPDKSEKRRGNDPQTNP